MPTDRFQDIERRYEELNRQLSSPEVASDPSRLRDLGKQHADGVRLCEFPMHSRMGYAEAAGTLVAAKHRRRERMEASMIRCVS